ncbi:MAG: hypothetical protein M1586_01880 [Patescibacteria group bacterium]|nr:hypothetical protein [Patescibacteria group bacterium]MCL5262032.1 hypothetical protein [Patescibacteria group bacterium]
MKNKIVLAGILAITLVFAGNAYAVGPNANGAGDNNQNTEDQPGQQNQIQNQNQVQNQGEEDEVKTQEQEGQEQEEQGQEQEGQEQEQEKTQEVESVAGQGEERRSKVADAVQQMLQVADRSGGIGSQVRVIAQSQSDNHNLMEATLQKAQSRSQITKFLIGPNYGEINNAQKLVEQNQAQIQQLVQLRDRLTNQGDIDTLNRQIQILEQVNAEVQKALQDAEQGFSVFGWLFKLFSK